MAAVDGVHDTSLHNGDPATRKVLRHEQSTLTRRQSNQRKCPASCSHSCVRQGGRHIAMSHRAASPQPQDHRTLGRCCSEVLVLNEGINHYDHAMTASKCRTRIAFPTAPKMQGARTVSGEAVNHGSSALTERQEKRSKAAVAAAPLGSTPSLHLRHSEHQEQQRRRLLRATALVLLTEGPEVLQ